MSASIMEAINTSTALLDNSLRTKNDRIDKNQHFLVFICYNVIRTLQEFEPVRF